MRAPRRAALAVFAVFAMNGFVFATWFSRLPAIRDALSLTPGQVGAVLLVGAAGSLVALPLTGVLVQRVGTAVATRLAVATAAVGFGSAAASVGAGSAAPVAISLFVASMGMGAWDVSMNLQGAFVEHDLGRSIMPRFHAGFSLGTVLGAGLGALAASADWSVTGHVLAAVGAGCAVALALTTAYVREHDVIDSGGAENGRNARAAFGAWLERRTVLIGLVVLAAGLTEGSANDWLALAVVDGFQSSDAVGALAFGVFVTSMTAMRFGGTRLLDRFGRVAILRLGAGLALAGLLVFGLIPALPLALAGAALWGLGAALGFPVGMSAASDDPARAAARVSVVSTIGYLAFLAGPPLLGLLADQIGYRHALLVIAVPLLFSLVLSPAAAPLGRDVAAPPVPESGGTIRRAH